MPKTPKPPAKRGKETRLTDRRPHLERARRLKPFDRFRGGSRGKPPRFPGRTGGR